MPETAIRERSILFSAPMIRALLDGRKTQTRRWLKVPNHPAVADWVLDSEYRATARPHSEEVAAQYVTTFPNGRVRCPYGVPGDRLWVKEACAIPDPTDHRTICYRASGDPITAGAKWRSPIHMPRRASRITLEIESVRVERVQDIGKDGRAAHDVLAEGITRDEIDAQQKFFHPDDAPAIAFACLWDSIAKPGAKWADNPWTWVLIFKRILPDA